MGAPAAGGAAAAPAANAPAANALEVHHNILFLNIEGEVCAIIGNAAERFSDRVVNVVDTADLIARQHNGRLVDEEARRRGDTRSSFALIDLPAASLRVYATNITSETALLVLVYQTRTGR